MFPIQKENFEIRPWKLEDAESLSEQANNVNIWNNVRDGFPHPYTKKNGKAFIKECLKRSFPLDYAIVVDGKAVGGVGFILQSDVERYNAELGYWIGEAYWNKGIITEAVRAAIRIVFQETDIARIYACAYAYNTASMRVMEKNGFRKVGVMEKAAFKNGAFVDFHYYELLR
ncbi:GNAT family N-acetyltransferase [Parabacteroides sp. PF5-9]|uniref:GNAT family N-acetyltransferase n=1 Tax=Parabacteroides sp. PF5-9 TaxID=1742404 RepID=UPI0024768C46|nr:GNAT family N-acetyltransferase [Parabacteroides sp. PF5-9]MDH6357109.1 ribosomal-protein-alanine N-acetyltransferase [Parabacteroides sp. PF5-9]